MTSNEIWRMPAVDMAAAIRGRQLSPVEATDAVLDRIEQVNPKVNAFCTVTADAAREQAKQAEAAVMRGDAPAPLLGVPVSIKDLTPTRGVRTTFGSKVFEDFVPDEDAIIVERLKAAGAVILGKTNTPEFGFMGVTDNAIFGATRNPWHLERHAGGSSGGAAAAVVSGMGPLAQGSDGGGSIRIPSSFCGAFGLKPSYGRVPRGPGVPDWQTLSHIGPITRTVADAALMMEAIAGRDERDRHSLIEDRVSYLPLPEDDLKGIRIAWSSDMGYATVDPEVLAATTSTLGVFQDLGADVQDAGLALEHPGRVFFAIWGVTFAASHLDKLEQWRDAMNPRLVAMIEQAKDIPAITYAQATRAREELWQKLRPTFAEYDVLLTPATAVAAFDVNTLEVTEIGGVKGAAVDWTPFSYPFNFTGQPAASVPCGWTSEGTPIGLQIVGRRYDEATVLKVAAAFERAAPWADHWPAL
jgi:aspartyl-tRNA(Asn)/glutamyl-tRNA(Gln) amidotransferase subunit A